MTQYHTILAPARRCSAARGSGSGCSGPACPGASWARPSPAGPRGTPCGSTRRRGRARSPEAPPGPRRGPSVGPRSPPPSTCPAPRGGAAGASRRGTSAPRWPEGRRRARAGSRPAAPSPSFRSRGTAGPRAAPSGAACSISVLLRFSEESMAHLFNACSLHVYYIYLHSISITFTSYLNRLLLHFYYIDCLLHLYYVYIMRRPEAGGETSARTRKVLRTSLWRTMSWKHFLMASYTYKYTYNYKYTQHYKKET